MGVGRSKSLRKRLNIFKYLGIPDHKTVKGTTIIIFNRRVYIHSTHPYSPSFIVTHTPPLITHLDKKDFFWLAGRMNGWTVE